MNLPNQSKENELHKKFLCCLQLNDLNWEFVAEEIRTDGNVLNKFLDLTVMDRFVLKYPLKVSYQVMFLKRLEKLLEASNCEVSDVFYEVLCSLVAKKSSDVFYRHYLVGDSENRIIMKEHASVISNGTTGLHSWEASIALSEWMLQNQLKISGKTILELGSGTGLVGLIAYKMCSPTTFYLSDCHPLVLKNLCDNVKLNLENNLNMETVSTVTSSYLQDEGTLADVKLLEYLHDSSKIEVLNLPWEKITPDICGQLGKLDLVVGSDIVYDSSIFSSLMTALTNLLQYCLVEEFVFACTVRNEETLKSFLESFENTSLVVSELPLPIEEYLIWKSGCEIRMFSVKTS